MLTPDEVIQQFGNIPLKFSRYAHFTFSFYGLSPADALVQVTYGGSPDAIADTEITPATKLFLGTDPDDLSRWTSIRIEDKMGNVIFERTEVL